MRKNLIFSAIALFSAAACSKGVVNDPINNYKASSPIVVLNLSYVTVGEIQCSYVEFGRNCDTVLITGYSQNGNGTVYVWFVDPDLNDTTITLAGKNGRLTLYNWMGTNIGSSSGGFSISLNTSGGILNGTFSGSLYNNIMTPTVSNASGGFYGLQVSD